MRALSSPLAIMALALATKQSQDQGAAQLEGNVPDANKKPAAPFGAAGTKLIQINLEHNLAFELDNASGRQIGKERTVRTGRKRCGR
jgi:hypothetical protein